MKQRLCTITLSLLLTLSLLPAALAAPAGAQLPFTDVREDSPYYQAVDYVYQTGLMNGVSKTRFDPSGLFSRAMFVTILGRMDGVNMADYPGTDFTDVSVKTLDWAAPYIKWASENGIVNGYGNGKFGPDDPITKEQYCAVVDRYCNAVHRGFAGTFFTPYFKDAEDISLYAFQPVYNLVGYDLIDTQDGFFRPQHRMTRGEIAVTFSAVHRMINGLPATDLTTNYVMSNYLGWQYGQVTSLFAGEPVLMEDWWHGYAKFFSDEYGYPPFDFAYNDYDYRDCPQGNEPVTLVQYITGRGFPSVQAAPGVDANATVADLQRLGVPGVLYLGEKADSGDGQTAVFYMDFDPDYSILFNWYAPGADPYHERADEVIVYSNN